MGSSVDHHPTPKNIPCILHNQHLLQRKNRIKTRTRLIGLSLRLHKVSVVKRGTKVTRAKKGDQGERGKKGNDGMGLKEKMFKLKQTYNKGDYVFSRSSSNSKKHTMYTAQSTFT